MNKLIILFLFFAGSCSQNPVIIPNSVDLNRPFNLAVNQQAVIQGTNVTISFRAVTEDSRCPDNVRCIWAGNAELLFGLRDRGTPPVSATINTNLEPKLIQYSRYQIQLLNLTPYPHAPVKIEPMSYIATIVVSTR